MRCALLRDFIYIFSVAVHAGHGDGFNFGDEFIGVHFTAKTNFHGNFNLFVARRGGSADIRGQWRSRKTFQPCRRILFCVAFSVSGFKFFQRHATDFKTLRAGEYFFDNADNLRGRIAVDVFSFGHNNLAGGGDGCFAVYPGRRDKNFGGGFSRRKNKF